MAKRFLLKQFAKDASNNGVYGSYQAGNPTYSNDPETIQSLPAWFTGWINATTSGTLLPRLEEMQGVQKVLCEAIKENYREGVPEWINGEEYYKNSIVSYSPDGTFNLYYNITGDYTDKTPDEDTVNWANLSTLFIDKKYLEENYINLNTISNCLLKSNDSTSFAKYNAAYVNFGAYISGTSISAFSPQRYIVLTKSFPDVANAQISDAWRVQTGTEIDAQQVLICAPTIDNSIGIIDGRFYICLGGKLQKGTKALAKSKTYYLKLSWTTTNVRLQVSEDNKSYTEDINFATTEQPMAGKTTLLGRGDTANADTFFMGNMDFPVFKNTNGTVYWNSTTASNINLIHFLGTFECLAPNGRDANNNLKNETFTELVDSFMNYTPLTSDGTKTILLTNKGELMAREKYTEAATAPGGAKLNDVWYDTEKNFMYQQSTEQPNFITNGSIQVNRGIVSGFSTSNSLYLDNGNNGVFDKSLITNLLEVELTTGTSSTENMSPVCAEGSYALLTNNKTLSVRIRLQSYEVGIRTDEGGYSNTKYVNSADYTDNNGYIRSGTTLYNTNVCQSEGAISCPPNQYEYVSGSPEEILITITSKVQLSPSTAYNVGIVYLDGKWTLMVGDIVDEYESYAETTGKDFKVGFGLFDVNVIQGKPFDGTINLANTTFSGWEWNGVSTSTLNWNQFVGCKIGTITQKSGNITVSIDKPVELVKKVDFDKGIANLQSQISSNDTDISGIKGNYVTTNTNQQITATKTFNGTDGTYWKRGTYSSLENQNWRYRTIRDVNNLDMETNWWRNDTTSTSTVIHVVNNNTISEEIPANGKYIDFRILVENSGLAYAYYTGSRVNFNFPQNDKTTKLPTTIWVQNNFVNTYGNQTLSGYKVWNADVTYYNNINPIDIPKSNVVSRYINLVGNRGTGFTNTAEMFRIQYTLDVNGTGYTDFLNKRYVDENNFAWGRLRIATRNNTDSYVQFEALNKNLNNEEKSSGTNDLFLATKGWVSNPNTSTNVVHRTANETISGVKTFSNAPTFNAGANFNGTSAVNMQGTLYFKNGSNTQGGINQGSSGDLYISNPKAVDITGSSSVRVPTSEGGNVKDAVNVEYLNNRNIQSIGAAFPDFNNVMVADAQFVSGMDYIMPANGFVYLECVGNNSGLGVLIGGYNFQIGGDFEHYHVDTNTFVPVRQGTLVHCNFKLGNSAAIIFGVAS